MDFWRFTTVPGSPLVGSYDPMLVLLSIAIACAAGTTVLLLVDRMVDAQSRAVRAAWHGAGALTVGLGIWTMHFAGMLAFSVPIEMAYSVPITLLSILPAILGGGAALHFIAQPSLSHSSLQLGALLVALGIGAMHYMGMEAMELAGALRYAPILFILSLVVAHILAMLAIYVRLGLSRFVRLGNTTLQVLAGSTMGLAVVSMHYTAMAATRIYDVPASSPDGWVLSNRAMLETVAGFGGLVFCLSVVAVWGAQRSVRRRLYVQAHTDALTGLPNRLFLQKTIERELNRCDVEESHLAVLFIDLVDFKRINDSFGHHAGDQVLQAAADRVRGALKDSDTVARFGGDEFVVVTPYLPRAAKSEEIAQRLARTLDRPIECEGWTLSIHASIGISVYPDDASTVDQLLQHADTAMYRAKAQGTTWCVFDQRMGRDARERIWLSHELPNALAQGQLRLHYQPIVDLSCDHWVGFEALVRWRHPTAGHIAPARFVPMAERSGLILQLDEWGLRACLAQAKAWLEAGLPFRRIAFNLSAAELSQRDIVNRVRSLLDEIGVSGTCLELELTESSLMRIDTDVLARLQQLREMGVNLSLDDFGTGYSSLRYLRSLPVDKIKIDRSFVHNVATEAGDQAIVRAVIEMGLRVNFTVVAEGVETENQRRALLDLGCTVGQGFLFARPVSAQTIERIYASRGVAPASRTGSGLEAIGT